MRALVGQATLSERSVRRLNFPTLAVWCWSCTTHAHRSIKGANLALSAKQTAEVTHALDALEQRLRDEMRQAAPQAATENFRELAGEVHDAGEESVAVTVEDTRRSLQGRQ